MAQTILLVDDDESLLRLLTIRLQAASYTVIAEPDARHALNQLVVRNVDLVITDLRMPGLDGMQLYESIHERRPTLPVIMLTAHGTIPDAVNATRAGVFAFLTKPFDSTVLIDTVRRALAVSAQPRRGDEDLYERTGIRTCSPVMREVLRRAALAAASDVPVMVLGESGSGKELLARAVHRMSPRAGKPFSGINCAALPETLFESELFGHEKGAFTGAQVAHLGVFRAADSGTVFLDEIGDMPLPLQVKLLRVLQDKEVRPVGGLRSYPIDVRIISATHQQPENRIAAGQLREDLYYRLKGVVLKMPSLAERREDIPLLAAQFVDEIAEDTDTRRRLSSDAVELLASADWPGNVRQLRNVIQQSIVLSPSDVVPASVVMAALEAPVTPELQSFDSARREFERDYLVRVLKLTQGNVTRAAQLSQRNRQDFYKLLKRHGLEPAMFKTPRETVTS
jgi:two-component system, NtrC family, response regulator GlrR